MLATLYAHHVQMMKNPDAREAVGKNGGTSHIGIVASGEEFQFCTLQFEDEQEVLFQAFVDGPYRLYERLDNRNWRAGESYCTNWDSSVIGRLMTYWSL